MDLRIKEIVRFSSELGFSGCGIVPVAHLAEEEEHLRTWLDQGFNGEMHYLSRDPRKRCNPALLMEGAPTLIMVTQNYYTPVRQTDTSAPILSRYAYGKDYHEVVKSKLHVLLNFIRELLPGIKGRVFADSAPLLEKAWATRAGLGWIGKNTLLISPEAGSFFFLGGILLDKEIPVFSPEIPEDRCRTCTLCLDACPTGALVAPRILDARRCISYQTIEHKKGPDDTLKGHFRNRVFGCDICQEVCPWNRKALPHSEKAFLPAEELEQLTAAEWESMDLTLFSRLFSGTPVMRAGYEKNRKNLDFLKGHQPADE